MKTENRTQDIIATICMVALLTTDVEGWRLNALIGLTVANGLLSALDFLIQRKKEQIDPIREKMGCVKAPWWCR